MFKLLPTILIGMGLTLVGCSQNNNPQTSNPREVEPEIRLEAGVGSVSGNGEYGTIVSGSKVVTFSIYNSGDAALVGPPSLDNTNFSIVYQNNCANILPKKTCQLKISFSSTGKSPGDYNSVLSLDSVTINLHAAIASPVSTAESVVFNLSNVAITTLDFGTLNQTQSVTKTISMKNTSSVAINKALSLTGSNYLIAYDTCSNKSLGAGASCSIKLSISGSGKGGLISDTLKFGTLEPGLTLSTNVIAPEPANLKVFDGTTEVSFSTPLDFGTVSPSTYIIKNLTVKNLGGSTANLNIAISGDANFSIAYSGCTSSLPKNSSCPVKVKMEAGAAGVQSFSSGPSTFADSPVEGSLALNEEKSVDLTGNISSPPIANTVEAFDAGVSVSEIQYPEIAHNGSLFKTITIKNTGTVAINAAPSMLNNPSAFNIFYTNCQNLNPNSSCQIRLGIVGFGNTPGSKTDVLKIAAALFPVSASIAYPPISCPVGQEAKNGVCQDIIVLSKISLGTGHACALNASKNLLCWGANYFGQVGINSLVDSVHARPVQGPLAGQVVDQVAAFGGNTCALSAGKVYCWGYGYYGGVGNGAQNDTLLPVEISNQPIFAGKNIVQLTGGGYGNSRICALTDTGASICWGQGPFGPRPTPVDGNSQAFNGFGFTGALSGQVVDQYFIGQYHFGAIVNGVAYSWGPNFPGDGVNSAIYTPTLLSTSLGFVNSNVQQLAYGSSSANSCVLASGRVYCWGNNGNGEIGDGVVITTYDPTLAPKETLLYSASGNKLASSVSVGEGFACSLVDGKVYCWGKNSLGQLGDGTTTTRYSPVLVGIGSALEGKTVISVNSSGNSSCASTTEGKTYCWGFNNNGELGIGYKSLSVIVPTEISIQP